MKIEAKKGLLKENKRKSELKNECIKRKRREKERID